jgi:Kef-type K+ transport system membrane component KefB
MLWRMRNRLLGLGGLQVARHRRAVHRCWAGSSVCNWRTALAVGLLLSLSSTAIVLQTFQEKGLSKTEGARSAFSVLLFQDIAVIPMLALIPLLAMPELAGGMAPRTTTTVTTS